MMASWRRAHGVIAGTSRLRSSSKFLTLPKAWMDCESAMGERDGGAHGRAGAARCIADASVPVEEAAHRRGPEMAPFFCRLVMAPPLPPALTFPGLAQPAAPGLALPAAPAAPGLALPSAGSGELAILASGNGSRDSHQIWLGDTLRGACGEDHFEKGLHSRLQLSTFTHQHSRAGGEFQGVRVYGL